MSLEGGRERSVIRGTFENMVDFVPELSRLATFALHQLRKILFYKRTKFILHVYHVPPYSIFHHSVWPIPYISLGQVAQNISPYRCF